MDINPAIASPVSYVAFDADNRPVAYDSQPIPEVTLCIDADDIVAAFQCRNRHYLDIAAPSGNWHLELTRYDWLTIVRDLGLRFDPEGGDYLPQGD